jgi:hypothetical protein
MKVVNSRIGRLVVFIVVILGLSCCFGEEWDDLSVLQVNAERPHANMMIYPDKAGIRSDIRSAIMAITTNNSINVKPLRCSLACILSSLIFYDAYNLVTVPLFLLNF